MSAAAFVDEPRLLGAEPPPVRDDRRVRVWVAAVTVSWFGDAMWTVALAWTAALLAFGAVAAGAGLTVTCCLFGAAMGTLCLTLATRRAVSALH